MIYQKKKIIIIISSGCSYRLHEGQESQSRLRGLMRQEVWLSWWKGQEMEQAQSSAGLSEDRARDQGQMQSCVAQWLGCGLWRQRVQMASSLTICPPQKLSECLREAVLTQGDSATTLPTRHLWQCLEIHLIITSGSWGTIGILCIEARDAAKHPMMPTQESLSQQGKSTRPRLRNPVSRCKEHFCFLAYSKYFVSAVCYY